MDARPRARRLRERGRARGHPRRRDGDGQDAAGRGPPCGGRGRGQARCAEEGERGRPAARGIGLQGRFARVRAASHHAHRAPIFGALPVGFGAGAVLGRAERSKSAFVLQQAQGPDSCGFGRVRRRADDVPRAGERISSSCERDEIGVRILQAQNAAPQVKDALQVPMRPFIRAHREAAADDARRGRRICAVGEDAEAAKSAQGGFGTPELGGPQVGKSAEETGRAKGGAVRLPPLSRGDEGCCCSGGSFDGSAGKGRRRGSAALEVEGFGQGRAGAVPGDGRRRQETLRGRGGGGGRRGARVHARRLAGREGRKGR
mmetsp:Transcript_14414/g.49863  ORF Transcript_14414/g.49863 Transcript_14414/m.49863 type:complete len:317 (+) Transcript_14414:569-1519(+)